MPPLVLFTLKRLAYGALTLLFMSMLVFAATQVLPGDTASAVLGKSATPERLASVRAQLGLTESPIAQYWDWITGVLRGDLGDSLTAQIPVTDLINTRVVNSVALVALASLLSIPIALALGALAGARRDSLFDHLSSSIGVVLASLPEFVIGILLILLLATGAVHFLPPTSQINDQSPIWTQLNQVALPALALAVAVIPYVMRILRASVIEVYESEYVQLARLKGVSEKRILMRHVIPNAIIPSIHVIAMCLGWLAGGIVVIEYLFNFPGIGSSLVDAVQNRDVPVIQAIILLVTGFYILCNIGADLLTVMLSPRARTALI